MARPQPVNERAMARPGQLGFGFDQMLEEQRTAGLPSTMEDAVPFYRALIERYHAAMIAGDAEGTMALRDEAHDLAIKLNGGTLLGICGGPDAPGNVLERAAGAEPGAIPLWGQEGSFIIDVNGLKVRIEQFGIFGVSTAPMCWPGFGAHAVDYQRPFLSAMRRAPGGKASSTGLRTATSTRTLTWLSNGAVRLRRSAHDRLHVIDGNILYRLVNAHPPNRHCLVSLASLGAFAVADGLDAVAFAGNDRRCSALYSPSAESIGII